MNSTCPPSMFVKAVKTSVPGSKVSRECSISFKLGRSRVKVENNQLPENNSLRTTILSGRPQDLRNNDNPVAIARDDTCC